MRELLTLAIKKFPPVHIDHAEDGVAALRQIRSVDEAYDLIFLDLNMPIMGGMKLLGYVRDEELLGNTSIAVVTTEESMQTEEQARSLGAAYFLRKPVTRRTVEDVLVGVFEARDRRLAEVAQRLSAEIGGKAPNDPEGVRPLTAEIGGKAANDPEGVRPLSAEILTNKQLCIEILRLLLQVAWVDDEIADNERTHIMAVAERAELDEGQLQELSTALTGQSQLPAPDLGYLRQHQIEALRAAAEFVALDRAVSVEENKTLTQIRDLLSGLG